ncbi:hypothetical protein CISIN_1g043644mg [Citrus sinensis]|uniref:Peptidase S8/S53 domain-containing protein n=1 Tax=Citrus sinensis TaxID=2711 RepID=A0A067D2F6_CITSI|nr:hypothetical protein CISIN_1g043644mg [Citrus sinensis]
MSWLEAIIGVLRFFLAVASEKATLAHHNNYTAHMGLSAMPEAFLGQQRCVSLTPADLESLKSSPGYISSLEDLPVKPDTTHSSQFLGLNSKSGAWPVSKFGQDFIIACQTRHHTFISMLYTGVWPESESYDDSGMNEIPSRWKGECKTGTQFNSSLCNKKLIGAQIFNRRLLAKFPNITIAMNSAGDPVGHGTHNSSIAAGSYVEGASYFGYATGIARGTDGVPLYEDPIV